MSSHDAGKLATATRRRAQAPRAAGADGVIPAAGPHGIIRPGAHGIIHAVGTQAGPGGPGGTAPEPAR
jgi:hypothetical protein